MSTPPDEVEESMSLVIEPLSAQRAKALGAGSAGAGCSGESNVEPATKLFGEYLVVRRQIVQLDEADRGTEDKVLAGGE